MAIILCMFPVRVCVDRCVFQYEVMYMCIYVCVCVGVVGAYEAGRSGGCRIGFQCVSNGCRGQDTDLWSHRLILPAQDQPGLLWEKKIHACTQSVIKLLVFEVLHVVSGMPLLSYLCVCVSDEQNQPLHLITSSDKHGSVLLKVEYNKVNMSILFIKHFIKDSLKWVVLAEWVNLCWSAWLFLCPSGWC